MRFALIDNKRIVAEPTLKGLCPGCYQPVIARCGTQRIHHWAHADNKECDSWWEPQTEWHRSWKNNFPVDWQEIFLPDSRTGEKHIADVRTGHGLVIEFQHSHIKPQERTAREQFYRNMVWVIDGTRLKRDYLRFLKGKEQFRAIVKAKGIYRLSFPKECFPSTWLESPVPVIFDFRGNESLYDPKDVRHALYWVFPERIGGDTILAVITRGAFIDAAKNGNLSAWAQKLADNIRQVNQELQKQQRI